MKPKLKASYTTGEVAKICGLKSPRVVARMFDYGEIDGELVQSQFGRRSTRRIPLKSLIKYMQKNKICLKRLSVDTESLINKTSELEKLLERSGKRGVFSPFNGLSERLMDMVKNLDPITSLSGVSEDKRRVANLKRLIAVMELHISIRKQIAKPPKK